MATGVMEEAIGFVCGQYKKNPNITAKELKSLGAKKGINIYPVIIGKAKTRMGMGKGKPGRPPKAATSTASAAPRRGPGRPPKNRAAGRGAEGAVATLNDVAALVKRLQADVASANARLGRIAELAAV